MSLTGQFTLSNMKMGRRRVRGEEREGGRERGYSGPSI
jgi:hypothetical protein